MKKNIIFIIVIIIITVIILLVLRQGSNKSSEVTPSPSPSLKSPGIISTKPDLLSGETIIAANQTIELMFNRPLENVPELKLRLEPKADYKVELSFDRQKALIIPTKPFELGTAYTLTILKDSKFEGGGRLNQEVNLHFRTVRYRGI